MYDDPSTGETPPRVVAPAATAAAAPAAVAPHEAAVVAAAPASPPSTALEVKDPRAARDAFKHRDADASRVEHDKAEPHGAASGDLVKALVFGGLDGVMTIFAVVTAAAGGGSSWQVVLVFGLANLVADAWSMGFGEFLGGMAEMDQAIAEREREAWEFDTVFEEEKEELKLIYMKKGYPEEDAQGIVDILAKSKVNFVDAMMKDELNISADLDDYWAPLKCGATMFSAFCIFGLVPLVPYFSGKGKGTDKIFYTSCGLVGVSLMLLGCIKGYLTDRPMFQMAMMMLFSGVVSGAVSFLVSGLIGAALA